MFHFVILKHFFSYLSLNAVASVVRLSSRRAERFSQNSSSTLAKQPHQQIFHLFPQLTQVINVVIGSSALRVCN